VKLDYKHNKEEWKAAARSIQSTIAGATRAAFQDLAVQVQRQGRAEIARSGLSRRWQTGFKTYVFPRRPGAKGELAMRGQHSIGYANVFERGARIAGLPLLWVPLPTAPKKINGKATTARAMIEAGVRLFKIERSGRPPLLAGYAMRSGRQTSIAASGGAAQCSPPAGALRFWRAPWLSPEGGSVVRWAVGGAHPGQAERLGRL
jgi:hypothetical protein